MILLESFYVVQAILASNTCGKVMKCCVCGGCVDTTNKAIVMTSIICGTILVLCIGVWAIYKYYNWRKYELEKTKASEKLTKEAEEKERESLNNLYDRLLNYLKCFAEEHDEKGKVTGYKDYSSEESKMYRETIVMMIKHFQQTTTKSSKN